MSVCVHKEIQSIFKMTDLNPQKGSFQISPHSGLVTTHQDQVVLKLRPQLAVAMVTPQFELAWQFGPDL